MEVPVRAPLRSHVGVGAVSKLQNAAAEASLLNDGTLCEPLSPALDGFSYALKLRSAQVGDGSNDLVGVQEGLLVCIHTNITHLACFFLDHALPTTDRIYRDQPLAPSPASYACVYVADEPFWTNLHQVATSVSRLCTTVPALLYIAE